MLDVCIYFVSNIHSSFQNQEKFVRACGWMCALVALRTDGDDGRFIRRRGRLRPHTLTDAVFVWGRGRRRVSSLHSAALRCCFFSLSLVAGAHVGRRVKTLDNTQTLTVRLRPREVERTLARMHFLGAKAKQGCEVCRSAARRHGFLVTSSLHLLSASFISFLLSV